MKPIINILESLSGVGLVLLILTLLLILNSWFFRRIKTFKDSVDITKKAISYLIIFIGTLTFILLLPIDKSLKGQILSFLGIIISAAIALSSTTVLGNLIAGIINNSMKRFRNGDLINVGDLIGRVTKKSMFHVEIQLEDSNFVTIPNLFIVSNPVKLTRKSNTVISATVSLGYNVSRTKTEEYLKKAALSAGLKDPYVYITELGDFSVTYKIHGFLENSDNFFSIQSLLKGNMIDGLHEHNIEIVSPSFMNQKKVDDIVFIPKEPVEKKLEQKQKSPEELIFDKAIKLEKIENKKDYLREIDNRIESLKEKIKNLIDEEEINKTKGSIDKLEEIQKKILQNIEEQNKNLNEKNT